MPGDRIHVEFKPVIGRLRVYDAEYLRISIDTWNERYFQMVGSADDFDSLIEELSYDLFDYISLVFFSETDNAEVSCKIKRINIIEKLS